MTKIIVNPTHVTVHHCHPVLVQKFRISWPSILFPPPTLLSLSLRLNKIGKQNPNFPIHTNHGDHSDDDDDGSPDMTAIVSALAQQQQRASENMLRTYYRVTTKNTCFQNTLIL